MLIDWDFPCLASLIVLQMFKVGPSISGTITRTSVSQFEPFRHLGSECLGSSLRQLTTQSSQTLTQLYLNSGGNLKIVGGGGNASTSNQRYSSSNFSDESEHFKFFNSLFFK
uniref:Uncharacterized protein n=1 Tax=Meloidogyne enterolobii TaxID=390850 RepID=A0A6V7VJ28_MELEN|nr:unnamed protein product [Meloidogyne enterolobii]